MLTKFFNWNVTITLELNNYYYRNIGTFVYIKHISQTLNLNSLNVV